MFTLFGVCDLRLQICQQLHTGAHSRKVYIYIYLSFTILSCISMSIFLLYENVLLLQNTSTTQIYYIYIWYTTPKVSPQTKGHLLRAVTLRPEVGTLLEDTLRYILMSKVAVSHVLLGH